MDEMSSTPVLFLPSNPLDSSTGSARIQGTDPAVGPSLAFASQAPPSPKLRGIGRAGLAVPLLLHPSTLSRSKQRRGPIMGHTRTGLVLGPWPWPCRPPPCVLDQPRFGGTRVSDNGNWQRRPWVLLGRGFELLLMPNGGQCVSVCTRSCTYEYCGRHAAGRWAGEAGRDGYF